MTFKFFINPLCLNDQLFFRMIILKGQNCDHELEHVRTDNVVALKCKLAEKINKNPVNIILKDENDVALDNNKYIPDELRSLRYSLRQESSNDIILNVGENGLGVPKLIQINPEQYIQELILIMMGIAGEQRELVVFNDNGERLSNDRVIRDCYLRYESVIKVCAESDVQLLLPVVNLTFPDEESRSIEFRINDSIEDAKHKICNELPINNDLTLFTENDFLEPGRRLIDYMVKNNSVIFYAELNRSDHVTIGESIKKGQIASILRGRINNNDIILKKYVINNGFRSLKIENHIKFLKYDITTLAKIKLDNHPRLVHMETMFEKDNNFYIGLEWMNESLKNYLPVRDEVDIFRFATQTLEGLSYLHGMKIIYRSLKCSSILLDGNRNVKLCNFHFSKYLLGGNEESRLYEATGSKPIEKNWAAPEMLKGNLYGLQADIWSYGATLIEMITSKPPYHDFNQSQIKFKLLNNERPTYAIPAECPRWVETIIDMCLKWEPLSRPTVDELMNEIINSQPR